MVESDGISKPANGEPGSGEAAQALRAILQTQYLRYLIISSWALGLLAVVGPIPSALWFFGTIAAQLHITSFSNYRHNLLYTKFDSFLNRKVHPFTTGDTLQQRYL